MKVTGVLAVVLGIAVPLTAAAAPPAPAPVPPARIYGPAPTVDAPTEPAPVPAPAVAAPSVPSPPPDVVQEATPYDAPDPNIYADSIDTDVAYDDQVAQSYDDGYDPQAAAAFTDSLAPYGTWIDDDAYGRVWMPSASIVGADFAPYATGGHWALTEYGWTWVSAWDWGWAPFHYGRWTVLGGRGWGWIPGTLWGPAWVAWRAGGGYVGWAPLPPRGIGLGRPIGPRSPWRFTAAAGLSSPRPAYLPARQVAPVFARTQVVSNGRALSLNGAMVRVNAGPARIGDPRGGPMVASRFATVAPRAAPAVAIAPRAGVAVMARPWVQAGATQQTPLSRWPTAGRPGWGGPGLATAAGRSSPVVTVAGPRAGFVGAPSRSLGTWGGNPSAARLLSRPGAASPSILAPAIPYAPRYQAPFYRSAPVARSFAPPVVRARPFAPAPFTRGPVFRPSAPSFGGARFGGGSSFSGGGARFGGGSSFSGGGAHFGGGSSFGGGGSHFGGGSSFGGGGGGAHFGGGGRGHR